MSLPPVWKATRTAYGSVWSKVTSAVTGSEGLPGTTRRSSITEVTESGRVLIGGTCLFLVGQCLVKTRYPANGLRLTCDQGLSLNMAKISESRRAVCGPIE